MTKMPTDSERDRMHHHHDNNGDSLARLLTDVLTRVRDESAFRAPPLHPKAVDAITAYEIMSAALNPSPAPALTDHGPTARAK